MRRVPLIAPEKDVMKELNWLREHRAEYANQWVALDGDRLISAGRLAKEVHIAAKAAGVPHALIVLVEPPDALPFAGSEYFTTVSTLLPLPHFLEYEAPKGG
jgi:hypothetical protein